MNDLTTNRQEFEITRKKLRIAQQEGLNSLFVAYPNLQSFILRIEPDSYGPGDSYIYLVELNSVSWPWSQWHINQGEPGLGKVEYQSWLVEANLTILEFCEIIKTLRSLDNNFFPEGTITFLREDFIKENA